MRVLLTGGAGFIGSHVAEFLLLEGHEVAIVDDLSRGRCENVPEDAIFYEADVRDGCEEVFAEFEPETLCHQAAQIDVRRSVAHPILDLEINTVGSLKLLENCVKYGVGRIVFASTGGAIYGEQDEFPATEGHPERPISPYGISKLTVEHYLRFYEAQHGLSYVALRYANVYGPRQDPHGEAGVVAIFAGRLANDEVCTINGDGEQTRDYVYVEDVAKANVLALGGGIPPGAYNIGTSVETSVNELHETMAKASGSGSESAPRPEYAAAKPGEQLRSSIDPSKADRVLGWQPRFDLPEGLKKTLTFFGAV